MCLSLLVEVKATLLLIILVIIAHVCYIMHLITNFTPIVTLVISLNTLCVVRAADGFHQYCNGGIELHINGEHYLIRLIYSTYTSTWPCLND